MNAYNEHFCNPNRDHDFFLPLAWLPASLPTVRRALRVHYQNLGYPIDWVAFFGFSRLYYFSGLHITDSENRRVQRFGLGRRIRKGIQTLESPLADFQLKGLSVHILMAEDQYIEQIKSLQKHLFVYPEEFPDDVHGDREFVRNLAILKFTQAATAAIEWKFFKASVGLDEYHEADSETNRSLYETT
jgi:hypothetical protein